MSYAIQYGPERKTLRDNPHRNRLGLLGIGAVVLAAAAVLLWPDGVQSLRAILFPWLLDSTVAAYGELLVQIQNGAEVTDALVVFCREVIRNAGVPV